MFISLNVCYKLSKPKFDLDERVKILLTPNVRFSNLLLSIQYLNHFLNELELKLFPTLVKYLSFT